MDAKGSFQMTPIPEVRGCGAGITTVAGSAGGMDAARDVKIY